MLKIPGDVIKSITGNKDSDIFSKIIVLIIVLLLILFFTLPIVISGIYSKIKEFIFSLFSHTKNIKNIDDETLLREKAKEIDIEKVMDILENAHELKLKVKD